MKLKRFTAQNMSAALKAVKAELGDDAVILSTRKIKGNDGKPTLEVTAAIEQIAPAKADAPKEDRRISGPRTEEVRTATTGTTTADFDLEPANNGEGTLADQLMAHGVTSAIAQKLQKAVKALMETGFSEEDGLEMVLSKLINFRTPGELLEAGKPFVLVGSTGAGKTTTLAKIAVTERMHGRKVALVTMDTYKIGGVEQLDIYADALKESLHVVKSGQTLGQTLEKIKGYDLILVDSAGVNPYERTRMADIAKQLDAVDATVALMLPSNLNAAEMTALPKAFGALKPKHLLFSKMDETSFLGGMVNTAIESGLPLCFATDGQRVPQDLLQLDAKTMSRRLLMAPTLPWDLTDETTH